jgi:hypothetical protein
MKREYCDDRVLGPYIAEAERLAAKTSYRGPLQTASSPDA